GDASRSRTVGAPTTPTGAASGADSNRACCPGTSVTTPLTNEASPVADGSEDRAAGCPPGGWTTTCGAPATSTASRRSPPSPGYASAAYPVVVTPRPAVLKPEIRDQVNSCDGRPAVPAT